MEKRDRIISDMGGDYREIATLLDALSYNLQLSGIDVEYLDMAIFAMAHLELISKMHPEEFYETASILKYGPL